MKKTFKKCFLMLFCALFILRMMPTASYAEERVSLTVTFKHNEQAVGGVNCKIYLVAESSDSGYVICDGFRDYNVELDTSDSVQTKELAETLAGYVKRDGLTPYDSGETDEGGLLHFPNHQSVLKKGLYLILCDPFVKDGYSYTTEPILLALPVYDASSDNYLYSVNVEPKCSGEPETPGEETVERRIIKVWRGDEASLRPESVTFDLMKDNIVFDTVTVTKDDNWRYEWNSLDKYNPDGTRIEWRAVERSVQGYTVSVIQDGITFVVTNTYNSGNPHGETTSRTVKKVWDDNGYESRRPEYITVSLLRNGKVYDTQKISAKDGWQYSWENLDNRDSEGKEYNWTVSEKKVARYSSEVKQSGTLFILKNEYTRAKLPQTGVLWWPVPVFTALGLMFFIIGLVYKKRHEDV